MSTATIETETKTKKSTKTSTKKKTVKMDEEISKTEFEGSNFEKLIDPPSENIEESISILKDEPINDDDETSNFESSIDKYTDPETYLNKYLNLIETLTFMTISELEESKITKDFKKTNQKYFSKINKIWAKFNDKQYEIASIGVSLKNPNAKPKKIVVKENCAINKEKETFKEVLNFIKLEEGTLISRGQVIKSINSFVKKEKTNNNPDIFVEGDNTRFALVGDLKVLFDFIQSEMIRRGTLKSTDEFPTTLSYKDIMKYVSYCFPEK